MFVHCLVESTRVILQPIRGVEGSDYINANYIDVSPEVTLAVFPKISALRFVFI